MKRKPARRQLKSLNASELAGVTGGYEASIRSQTYFVGSGRLVQQASYDGSFGVLSITLPKGTSVQPPPPQPGWTGS